MNTGTGQHALLSISVSPYKVATAQRHDAMTVTVKDSGTTPLAVVTSFEALQRKAGQCQAAKPPGWVTAAPRGFALKPGESHAVTIHVNAPASATGSYDLLMVSSAVPASALHSAMGDRVGGGVGVRTEVSLGGHTAGRPCAIAAQPKAAPPASGGFPVAGLVGGVAGLLLVLLVVWGAVLRHRRRQA